jgi:hypothetical protein
MYMYILCLDTYLGMYRRCQHCAEQARVAPSSKVVVMIINLTIISLNLGHISGSVSRHLYVR